MKQIGPISYLYWVSLYALPLPSIWEGEGQAESRASLRSPAPASSLRGGRRSVLRVL